MIQQGGTSSEPCNSDCPRTLAGWDQEARSSLTVCAAAAEEAEVQQNGTGGGRASQFGGRGRGRALSAEQGNRRTHAFKDANKAAIGNHHRKDRALRKLGGPAS